MYSIQVIVVALLATIAFSKQKTPTDVCLDCNTTSCALLPDESGNPFCYEGTLEDANNCYNNDIAVPSDGATKCGLCSEFGYTESKG